MKISRRGMISGGTAGALAALTASATARSGEETPPAMRSAPDVSLRFVYPAYMVNWHLSTCCRFNFFRGRSHWPGQAGQLQSYIRLLKWKGLPSEPSWNPRAVGHSNPGLQTSRAGYRLSTAPV